MAVRAARARADLKDPLPWSRRRLDDRSLLGAFGALQSRQRANAPSGGGCCPAGGELPASLQLRSVLYREWPMHRTTAFSVDAHVGPASVSREGESPFQLSGLGLKGSRPAGGSTACAAVMSHSWPSHRVLRGRSGVRIGRMTRPTFAPRRSCHGPRHKPARTRGTR
jgi:hypothetical protein